MPHTDDFNRSVPRPVGLSQEGINEDWQSKSEPHLIQRAAKMAALQLFVFPPRSAHQFAPAIRTSAFHFFRAIFAEGAFVRTDVSFATQRQFTSTSLALCSHLQRHVVSSPGKFIV